MQHFPRLFSPGSVAGVEIKNRVVFAATSSELADGDGFVTDEMVEYYAERARGGAGLLVLEATYVEVEGKRLHHNAMLHDGAYVEGMRRLCREIHEAGAKAAIQLNHGGRESVPAVSGSVPLAPSPIPSHFTAIGDAVLPKELTPAEIRRIIARFVAASARARDAGFDAVELHGAHGYLIGQFLSPESNRRDDDYGGDVTRRARFSVELVQAVKAELGSTYPVIFRMNGEDRVPHGMTLDEAVETALLLEGAGADAISVSGGIHAARPYPIVPGMSMPRGCYVPYAARLKERLRIPVMVVGRINTPMLAEEILEGGKADFICLSRALLADPHFPEKAQAGRVDDIAPCIACNECIATVHRHKGIACTVNPTVSRELEFKALLARGTSPRHVCVVGGGVAGMAAAVTAAQRGHAVDLFEADAELGGQLRLAHRPPHRDELHNALHHLRRQVDLHAIQVHLGVRFSKADALRLRPDEIILATGAVPRRPNLPGVDRPHVVLGWEVIAGLREAGRNCVVIGGGLVAVEAADLLASMGRHVAIVARSGLLRKAVYADQVYFQDRIRELGIEVFTDTRVEGIGEGHVVLAPTEGLRRSLLDVETVVLCAGYEPAAELQRDLAGLGIPLHVVGDAAGPRKFFEAIEEGTLTTIAL